MKPLDVGIDAASALRVCGAGRVRAVFEHAVYVDVPGGLIALTSSALPRGPLHVRVSRLPPVSFGDAVRLDDEALHIEGYAIVLDAPVWSPELPPPASLVAARGVACAWLPQAVPTLGVAVSTAPALPPEILAALGRGDLLALGVLLSGRGPGLTPAGDDLLAGVLLGARGIWGHLPSPSDLLRGVATNDIARAFLRCAGRGRCIEPVHDLLAALAHADRAGTHIALAALSRFGSSSGAALAYGVRAALLELPTALPHPGQPDQLVWSIDESDTK